MKRMVYLSIVVVPSLVRAQTPLSGQVWDGNGGPLTAAQSPYVVTGAVHVPAGQTLTIEPGVTVLNDQGSYWTVEGTVSAEGTAEAPIRLTGVAQAPGAWEGVYLSPGGTAHFWHAEVSFGGSWANPQVSAYFPAEFSMMESSVRSGGGSGLRVEGGEGAAILISGSAFRENARAGAEVSASGGSMTITCNEFSDNDGHGLVVHSGAPVVRFNTFADNGGSGLHAYGDVAAEDNYWNSADGPGGLGPGSGDEVTAEWGTVDVEPFATTPDFAACSGVVAGPPVVTGMFPESLVAGAVRRLVVVGENLSPDLTARLVCTDCADPTNPEVLGVVAGGGGGLAVVDFDLRGGEHAGGYDLVVRNPDGAEAHHFLLIQPFLSFPWIEPTGVLRIPVLPKPLFRTSCITVYHFSNTNDVGFFRLELNPPAPGVVRMQVLSGGKMVWDSEEAEDPTVVHLLVPVLGSHEVCLTVALAVSPEKVVFPAEAAWSATPAFPGPPLGVGDDFVIFGQGQQLTWKGVGSATKDAVKGMIVDTLISMACGGLADLLVGDENLTNLKKAVSEVIDGLPQGVAQTPEFVMKKVAEKLAEKIPGVDIAATIAGCLNQILGAFFNAFDAAAKGAADRLRAKHHGDTNAARLDAIDQALKMGRHRAYAAYAALLVNAKLNEPPCSPPPAHYDTRVYPVSAAWDPNDKTTNGAFPCDSVERDGMPVCVRYYIPKGQAGEPIVYVVLFENKAQATEPAAVVAITDVLDDDLDPATLEVLGTSHPAVLGAPAVDGQSVTFRFEGIDLPPNVNRPEGEGFVSFWVRPRPGLPVGTEIRNKASIVFDYNPPIETPEVVHVVGVAEIAADPESHDFGPGLVGKESAPATFTVANLGAQPLTLVTTALAEGDTGSFRVSSDGCSGKTLGLDETCAIHATFAPESRGKKQAALRVLSSDAARPALDIGLAGEGLGPSVEVRPGTASLPGWAGPGAVGVPVLQVEVHASKPDAVRVESLAFSASGAGDDARDVTRVRVVVDQDRDGVADPGEPEVWSGRYGADDGPVIATLDPAWEVPAGSSATFLVLYDFRGPEGAAGPAGVAVLALALVAVAVRRPRRSRLLAWIAVFSISGTSCGDGARGPGDAGPSDTGTPPVEYALTVTRIGAGQGTVRSDPAGIECGTACSAAFPAGTQVTLSAEADAGSVFTGFGGDCAGTAPCTLTLDRDHEVTASFGARRSYAITLAGLSATGVESGVAADASGLPVAGAALAVTW